MIEFIFTLPTWFTVVILLFGAAFTLVFGTMAVLGFRVWLSWKTTPTFQIGDTDGDYL